MYSSESSCICLSTLDTVSSFNFSHSFGSIVAFYYDFQMHSRWLISIDHLFICISSTCVFSFIKVLFTPLSHSFFFIDFFLIDLLEFLWSGYGSFDTCIENNVFQPMAYFLLLLVSWWIELNVMKYNSPIFSFLVSVFLL